MFRHTHTQHTHTYTHTRYMRVCERELTRIGRLRDSAGRRERQVRCRADVGFYFKRYNTPIGLFSGTIIRRRTYFIIIYSYDWHTNECRYNTPPPCIHHSRIRICDAKGIYHILYCTFIPLRRRRRHGRGSSINCSTSHHARSVRQTRLDHSRVCIGGVYVGWGHGS